MPKIWKAKTTEGYVLKVLAELLQNNVKTACFEVDKYGIKLKMMDNHMTVLIDLDLDANSFSIYKFKLTEKLYLGINLSHFYKMLKSVKKKDSLELYIEDSCRTELVIKVIPKENNRTTTSIIQIQNIQNLDIALPVGYEKPVIVDTTEFQKMCKGLPQISSSTHVESKEFQIRFSSNAGGVMKRCTEFGETEDSDDEKDEKTNEIAYSEDFDTDQLLKITKLAGLSRTMQIYPKNDDALLFRCQVGNLGKINIYLKPKSSQIASAKAVESENED